MESGSGMRAKPVVEEQTWESEILCSDYHSQAMDPRQDRRSVQPKSLPALWRQNTHSTNWQYDNMLRLHPQLSPHQCSVILDYHRLLFPLVVRSSNKIVRGK